MPLKTDGSMPCWVLLLVENVQAERKETSTPLRTYFVNYVELGLLLNQFDTHMSGFALQVQ